MGEKSSSKTVIINSFIYSASGILLKCFSFFLLPLYTAYLTTEDYGITSVVSSFTSTMSFVVALSLYSAIMRFYVDLKDNPEKLRRFYGTISLFSFLSGLIWMGIFTVCKQTLSDTLFSGIDFFPIIFVTLLEMIFTCQVTIFDDILKSQQKAMKSSIISLVYFFLKISLNILFVVKLKWGALGTLFSTLIVDVLYSLYFVVDLLRTKQIQFCLDWQLLKEALKYSIPIIPHNLSTRIAFLVSKVLITGTDSLSGLGVYAVATQFGDIADTLQIYVDKAYQPWLYEKLSEGDEDYKQTIRKSVKILLAILGLMFLGISLFAQDYILLFVNKTYSDAWKYIPLIVLVYTIKTAYYFYVEVLFYYKNASRVIFTATLTSSILNIILSAFFVPKYGIYGSVLADAVAMIIRVTIVIVISNRFQTIGLRLMDFINNFIIILAYTGIGLAPSLLYNYNTFKLSNFLHKVLVVLAYIGMVVVRNREEICPILLQFTRKRKS